MNVAGSALRELHRIHRQLAELRERLNRGPRRLKACEANVGKLNAEHEDAKQTTTDTRLAIDRKQLDLKSGEQKVVDLKAKLNSASSNKEYQALLEQIAAAEMAGSVLADEILEGFEKIDELEAAAGEASKTLAAAEQELERTRNAVKEEAATIEADLARLQQELTSAEDSLPDSFRDDYDRIVRGKGAEALAVVENGVCTGCGCHITLNMQSELKLSRAVFCKTCGALLYEPEPM